jgi:hypothetical protein
VRIYALAIVLATALCDQATSTPITTYNFSALVGPIWSPRTGPILVMPMTPITATLITDGALGELTPADVLSWSFERISSTDAGASITLDSVHALPGGLLDGTITMQTIVSYPNANLVNSLTMRYGAVGLTQNWLTSNDPFLSEYAGTIRAPFVPEPATLVLAIMAALIALRFYSMQIASGNAANRRS